MHPLSKAAAAYAVVLYAVSALNYIPGLSDEEGRTFGVFALDIYDDALHFASATWAAVAQQVHSSEPAGPCQSRDSYGDSTPTISATAWSTSRLPMERMRRSVAGPSSPAKPLLRMPRPCGTGSAKGHASPA